MRKIDDVSLELINAALGTTGGQSSQETILEDGTITQVLDIARIARRSRTLAPSTGIYWGVLENAHAGVGELSSVMDPYEPASGISRGGYPTVLPDGMDVYLLGAMCSSSVGSSTPQGLLGIITPTGDPQIGIGIDDGGSPVTAFLEASIPLVFFTDVKAPFSTSIFIQASDGQVFTQLRYRIRRGQSISFLSDATGAVILQAILMLGIFPVALGQDALT